MILSCAVKRYAAIVAVGMAPSCIPPNEAIVADGQSAMDDAVAQAKSQLDQSAAEWRQEAEAERQKFSRRFILPACGQADAPSDVRCGLVHKVYSEEEFRKDFAARHCAPGTTVNTERTCSEKLVAEFIRVIEQRYRVRFAELCKSGGCGSFLQVELRALRASNRQATDDYSYRMQIIDAAQESRSKQVLDELDAELESIKTWTQDRIEEAESQRAVLRGLAKGTKAVAAGLSAYAQTLQSASLGSGTYGGGLPRCSNDYTCEPGYMCVKEPGRLAGVCDRKLDGFGVPSFAPARPDSFGPGERQCFTVDDCPPSFTCRAGNCRKP
jgi:hypothetical protein